jgi:hypothetical protein
VRAVRDVGIGLMELQLQIRNLAVVMLYCLVKLCLGKTRGEAIQIWFQTRCWFIYVILQI